MKSGYTFINASNTSLMEQSFVDLYNYWVEIKGDKALPDRQSFNPAKFPKLLPKIFMLDMHASERAYRYALVGTEIVEFLGMNPTDIVVDGPLKQADTYERAMMVLDEKKPLFAPDLTFTDPDTDNSYKAYSVLHLPFSDAEGKRITKILCLSNITSEKKLFNGQ